MIIDIDILQSELPTKSRLIAYSEFIELTGLTDARVNELFEIGWLKAAQKTETSLMFLSADVYKVKKLERLCEDFDFPPLAAAIIVDLLEKVDGLEAQINELNSNKEL